MADIVETPEQAAAEEHPPLLVLEPLTEYLDAQGLGSGELALERIGEGHSNITFLIERDGERFVLRRPPRPPIPPSAHDVLREARLLTGVQDADVRTPPVLAVCDDESVIGAPFYVMEYIEGVVVTTQMPPALDSPDERRRAGEELVDALAEIHAVRLARVRARGLRQADRLPRAAAAPLQRPVGAQQDARAADHPGARRSGSRRTCPSRPSRRSSTATTGSATRCSRTTRPRG